MDLDALDSLLQLVVIVGAGLAWLLSGSRKRQQSRPQPGSSASLPRPGARRKPVTRSGRWGPGMEPTRASTSSPQGVSGPKRPQGSGRIAGAESETFGVEDLLRILTGEPGRGSEVGEEARYRESEEARSREVIDEEIVEREPRKRTSPQRTPLEEIFEAEARSLETLEAAGEASHQRFHQRYRQAQPSPQARKMRALGVQLRPETLRQGFLWQVVLGRPKGLE